MGEFAKLRLFLARPHSYREKFCFEGSKGLELAFCPDSAP